MTTNDIVQIMLTFMAVFVTEVTAHDNDDIKTYDITGIKTLTFIFSY